MTQRPTQLLLACTIAVLGATFGAAASAQPMTPAAPAASAAASVPEAPARRKPLSGEALRDSGTFPNDLEVEAQKPQIKVPLGRKPPVSATAASGTRADGDAPRPKVNDGVARCKAQPTAAAREECLRALPG